MATSVVAAPTRAFEKRSVGLPWLDKDRSMPFAKISRRHLLIAAGGGVVAAGAGGLWFGVWKAGQRRWAKPVERDQAFSPSVFLSVGEDNDVTIWVTKKEMGQGVMTGLAKIGRASCRESTEISSGE